MSTQNCLAATKRINPGQNLQTSRCRLSRYWQLPLIFKIIFLMVPVASVILFVLHWFSIPVFGYVFAGTTYYYLIYALLGFNIFMGLGATRRQGRLRPPWYDYVLASALVAIIVFFIFNTREIDYRNWDVPPDNWVMAAALMLGIISIEAGRRVGGWGYAVLLLLSILYPLAASHPLLAENLGGVFYGVSIPFKSVLGAFAFGVDGMLGTPGRLLGDTILGFFLFAGLVMGIGGGSFFMRLATAMLGHVRGGQAKVAVVASALFGSITGSPVANIAGTGSFTIPAMKESGLDPEYAAAVEACSSTGCDTVPPVLGGLVFLMVVMFGVDYADVIIATLIPSALFYLGLMVQVDGYAARRRLKPIDREAIPKWWKVLGEGWYYLAGLALLVFGLVYMRWGAITPVYAAVTVLILKSLSSLATCMFPGEGKRMVTKKEILVAFAHASEAGLVQTASLINYAAAIFLGMGFILVGLLKTGVATGLTNWMVNAGGENLYLILFACFAFSVIMGMGGLQRTAYILLALIAVPALINISAAMPEFAAYGGIPLIGLNLFFLFYSTLGGITPPVALHSVVAASIADANPSKTIRLSCRLGAVLFFIPFFFVMEPALLIIYAPWWATLANLVQAVAGVWLLSSGLEGYLIGLGVLVKYERILLFAGGFAIAFPQVWLLALGIILCLIAISGGLRRKHKNASSISNPVKETKLIFEED
ncbi:MAG: TRAP transporter fused permease subunit [Dehalococcoidaceae bacterium]|nr:TRAP transporter fused permease subunit [Dehalococcoidaceae bacterium]